ncbi:hypothetical protein [Frankia sp. Cj3]|nr:hypothetical protein [Frankia sp. Cj3]
MLNYTERTAVHHAHLIAAARQIGRSRDTHDLRVMDQVDNQGPGIVVG